MINNDILICWCPGALATVTGKLLLQVSSQSAAGAEKMSNKAEWTYWIYEYDRYHRAAQGDTSFSLVTTDSE